MMSPTSKPYAQQIDLSQNQKYNQRFPELRLHQNYLRQLNVQQQNNEIAGATVRDPNAGLQDFTYINPFYNMDMNQDGNVTPDEAFEMSKRSFSQFDEDGDGFIKVREIKSYSDEIERNVPRGVQLPKNAIQGNLIPLLSFLDANGDGSVSLNEYSQAKANDMRDYDLNGDGTVTTQETQFIQGQIIRLYNDIPLTGSSAEPLPFVQGQGLPGLARNTSSRAPQLAATFQDSQFLGLIQTAAPNGTETSAALTPGQLKIQEFALQQLNASNALTPSSVAPRKTTEIPAIPSLSSQASNPARSNSSPSMPSAANINKPKKIPGIATPSQETGSKIKPIILP